MLPLVSVVIPTYLRNDRLERTLSSVKEQSYSNLECIVVDDSGSGHAQKVIEKFDVQYIELDENMGAQIARTIGIRSSSGKYIQLLDDDDILLQNKISTQVELLESNSTIGVVYCGLKWESGQEVYPASKVRGDVLEDALSINMAPCVTSTMLIDRELLVDLLPLTDRPGADDIGFKIELAQQTQFDYVNDILVERGSIEGETSRGVSFGAIEGREEILSEYESLYNKHPRAYDAARADLYYNYGTHILRNQIWSATSIYYFCHSLYRNPSLFTLGVLLFSIFGRPGLNIAKVIYIKFVSGGAHSGTLSRK